MCKKNSPLVNIQNNNKSRGIKTKAGIRTRYELAFCLQKPSIHGDFQSTFNRFYSATDRCGRHKAKNDSTKHCYLTSLNSFAEPRQNV